VGGSALFVIGERSACLSTVLAGEGGSEGLSNWQDGRVLDYPANT
jgi:hypothetical protein